MKIMTVVGVRPQIIKAAPILHILNKMRTMDLQLIHTGQHYDYEMSRVFFRDFDLPDPLINLRVGSGSHTRQISKMMIGIERVIALKRPDIVVVFGDANTALAGGLCAAKMRVRVAHVEAGLRSGDMRMQEEINRILVDHCSSHLFAPTRTAVKNLRREGISGQQVSLCGDTMVDSMRAMKSAYANSDILARLGLRPESYVTLTAHRAENVDDQRRLGEIVRGVVGIKFPVAFPIHPRTARRLRAFGLRTMLERSQNVRMLKPLSYVEMLQLIKCSRMLLTDSGGMQKEAFLLHVPCLTLRENTEWVETLRSGANTLVGADAEEIQAQSKCILSDRNAKKRLKRLKNPFGDGKAAHRIVRILLQTIQPG